METKHLTSINDLTKSDILEILERTSFYANSNSFPKILENLVVANLFFEKSGHAKYSFEISAKRLNAAFVQYSELSSDASKGIPLIETINTFNYLGVNIVNIRHPDSQFIKKLKDKVTFQIINAGSGLDEHPTQSLLDLYTFSKQFPKLNGNVAIYGDIKNSRSARSFISLLDKLEIQTSICACVGNNLKNISLGQKQSVCNKISSLKTNDFHLFINKKLSIDEDNKNLYDVSKNDLDILKDDAFFTFTGTLNFKGPLGDLVATHQKSKLFEQLQDSIFLKMAIYEWLIR